MSTTSTISEQEPERRNTSSNDRANSLSTGVSAGLSKPKSELHSAARDLALRGNIIFPCHPGTKVPATPHGFKDASSDPAQIDAWWTENPDYNIAMQPQLNGWAVVDPDGEEGLANWASLEIEHGNCADTMTVRTPRGGRHLYFKGDLPPSQSKLAEKVDTRGGGSYVLLPPSVFAGYGQYVYERLCEPAPLPEWIGARLAELSHAHVESAIDELDLPVNVEKARRHLELMVQRGDVAIQDHGGNTKTFVTACELMNLGVSEEKALELMDGPWNAACDPPWERDELSVVVHNAASYAQNAMGCWGSTGSAAETFKDALDKLLPSIAGQRGGRASPFRLLWPQDMRSLPEPSYIVQGLIPDRAVTLIYGAPRSFKSFIALDLLVSVAAGIPALGRFVTVPGDTVLCAGEAAHAVAKKRLPAFAAARGIADRLDQLRFAIVPRVPRANTPAEFDDLIAQIEAAGCRPRLIAVDTVARAMRGLNENEAKDVGELMRQAERLRDQFDCAVLLVHHTGKDEGRGARGSNVFDGDPDASWEIKRPGDAMSVAMRCEKMKDADEPDDVHLKGASAAASLVFTVDDTGAVAEAAEGADKRLTPQRVGTALAALGAVEDEGGNSVTTQILAVELAGTSTDQKLLGSIKKGLNRRAQGCLEAYVAFNGDRGQGRMWWVPHVERPAEGALH